MTIEELIKKIDAEIAKLSDNASQMCEEYEGYRLACQDISDVLHEITKEIQPSLPFNLDEAANKEADDLLAYMKIDGDKIYLPTAKTLMIALARFGAEWMAGQEVKIGETKVYLEDDGDEPPYSQEWLDLESTEYQIPDGIFKNGDEVDVILRKKQ